MINLNTLIFLTASTESLGVRMQEATFNTLIGMVVVFVVLLIIAFIIYLFKYIPNGSSKKNIKVKQDKSVSKLQVSKSVAEQISPQKTEKDTSIDDLSKNTELVAVITAAIMASMGEAGIEVPEDGLIIRSIRRKNTYGQGKVKY